MVAFEQIISHRFRGFGAHESTMGSMIAALDFGVRQLEFDIRFTRCGTPIVTHDEHARDARGHRHHLKDVTAAQLPQLGGDFAHMSRAEDMFEAIAAHPNTECRLLVDVKDAGFEDMLYALVARHRLRAHCLWVSWLPEVLYAIRDLDADAPLCLSHWCEPPGAATRAVHRVFEAKGNAIPRPERRFVTGERSGWFVNGALRGEMRELVDWVCVPSGSVSRALVEDYHRSGIKLSAFSYISAAAMQAAEDRFGHDAFFSDAFEPFETLQPK